MLTPPKYSLEHCTFVSYWFYGLLLMAYCVSSLAYGLLLMAVCLPFTAYRVLFLLPDYRLVFTVYCLLLAAYWLLPSTC